nr:hypothetical protein BaRGS_007175 [Batillaria attramentaria]
MDLEFWSAWDKQTMEITVVDHEAKSSSEVIHWVYKFPNGFDYYLTYFDDPQTQLPSVCYNWLASTGVPEFVERLHTASKLMQERMLQGYHPNLHTYSNELPQPQQQQQQQQQQPQTGPNTVISPIQTYL